MMNMDVSWELARYLSSDSLMRNDDASTFWEVRKYFI